MNDINRIRLKIARGEFEHSQHTLFEKLDLYGFTTDDVLYCVTSCEHVVRERNDVRGTKYVILGYAINGEPIELVCRFRSDGILVFITIYDYENKQY